MDEKQILETWEIHNRINLYLLDATEAAGSHQPVSFERANCWRAVCSSSQCQADVAEGRRAGSAIRLTKIEKEQGAGQEVSAQVA